MPLHLNTAPRSLLNWISVGVGAVTFTVFFAGTLVLAELAQTTVHHVVLVAFVGSAGVAPFAAFFVSSLLALARIDAGPGTRPGRATVRVMLRGAFLMAAAPAIASIALTLWPGAPPPEWSVLLERVSKYFLYSLFALVPNALFVAMRARGSRGETTSS